jgi:hypothetical protein
LPYPALMHDFVIAVDTSEGMSAAASAVERGLPGLHAYVEARNIDLRIALISSSSGGTGADAGPIGLCVPPPLGSGNCPADSNPPKFHHVVDDIGSDNALNKVHDDFPSYSWLFRKHSSKTFLIVTRGDATTPPYVTAKAFRDGMTYLDPALMPRFRLSGLFAFTDCPALGGIEGLVYKELGLYPRRDFCTQNYDSDMDFFAQDLVSSQDPSCRWTMPSPPPGGAPGDFDIVHASPGNPTGTILPRSTNHDECFQQGGWLYDGVGAPAELELCGGTCYDLRVSHELGVEPAYIEVRYRCTPGDP